MAVGTTYFSKAAEAVDIAGRLKPFPICVAALKSSGGLDKVGCTRVCRAVADGGGGSSPPTEKNGLGSTSLRQSLPHAPHPEMKIIVGPLRYPGKAALVSVYESRRMQMDGRR